MTRCQSEDVQLIKFARDRGLSTAPAWIGLPDLSGVDLTQTQTFPVDKKARPRKRRWDEDWRELVIGASPYNRSVAPVPERRTVTVQEMVARKMLKLRSKLGITAEDLLPASVALEPEGEGPPSPSTRQDSASGRKHATKNDAGMSGDAVPTATLAAAHDPGRCGASGRMAAPDVGRWKKEVDDMLRLLGTDAEKCAYDYPMAELKQKVASSLSAPGGIERKRRAQEPQHHKGHSPPRKSQPRFSPARSSSSGPPARIYSGDQTLREDSIDRDGAAADLSYRLPEYRHDAPWPRPRPTAEAAAKARAERRARAERGVVSKADARAEMEERVSASLIGVIPEEFCRDAPLEMASEASVASAAKKKNNRGDEYAARSALGRGVLTSAATPAEAERGQVLASSSASGIAATTPASAAIAAAATGQTNKAHPTRSPRPPNISLHDENPGQSKRPRGATAAIPRGNENGTGTSDGGRGVQRALREGKGEEQKEGSGARSSGERSRRRLAAFLEGMAFAPETATDSANVSRPVRLSTTRLTSPSTPVATLRGGKVRGIGGFGGGGTSGDGSGGRLIQGPPSDEKGSPACSSDQAIFGVGGDALASTDPSRSMTANLVGLFERSLGLDVWADPVASQLARPLDAILAYLPPEGARLHEESGRRFLVPGGSQEAVHTRTEFSTPPTSDKLHGKPVTTAEAHTAITRARKGTASATPAVGRERQHHPASTSVEDCSSGGGINSSGKAANEQSSLRDPSPSGAPSATASLLTVTMEHGAVGEAPRAVWLGRMAAVMEARGDRDEALRLYGEAVTKLTGQKEIGDVHLGGGADSVAPSCGDKVGGGRDANRSPRGAEGRSEICYRTSVDRGSGYRSPCDDLFPYSARSHLLASMIARSYRRHFLRVAAAQTRVAAAFRGHLARAGDRKDRNRRVSAATFVARAWRRRMHRLSLVATTLQAVARGADGRRKAKELRILLRTAVMVQAVVRMFLAKSTAHRMRLEEASAKLLQALQRGFALRRVRATAISEIHGRMWRAALGLNRVARGFLHRRFAAMMRQVAVDREIERSEAEAGAVAGAVRMATTKADIYLTTDAGKAELAQETRRTKSAAVRAKILMRGASPEERRRANAQGVFDSFDVDGSGTIDNTELKSLMGALGVRMTDAELRVGLTRVDADCSGDVNFSEFYAWFTGESGLGDGRISGINGYGVDDGGGSFVETRNGAGWGSHRSSNSRTPSLAGSRISELSTATTLTAMSGRPPSRGSRGMRNAARTTFVKARRHLRSATGTDLQGRARRGVARRWVASAARDAQVRFREARPPPLECCVCHQPFSLYGDYWKHFGGGSLGAGAGLDCGKERDRKRETDRRWEHQNQRQHHHKERWHRGRLFLDPTDAVREDLSRRRGAERQWTRLLDERRCLEVAGVRAEAEEEARIAAKGSVGAREHAILSATLLAASLSELKKDSSSSISCTSESDSSTGATRTAIARLAFQAFDRDGNGALDVSELAGLLRVVRGIPGQGLSTANEAGRASVGKDLARAGTSADGLGIEAAMHTMDEDHSGQIDIDEFMRWFNGRDAGHGNFSHRGTGKRLFAEVLGAHDGGSGRFTGTSAHDCESDQQRRDGNAKDGDDTPSTKEHPGNDSGSGSDSDRETDSSSKSSSSSSSRSDEGTGDSMSRAAGSASKKAAEHGGAAGVANKEERKQGGGEKGEKQGIFGFRAWFKKAPPAAATETASKADSKKIKRKRWDEKKPEQEKEEEEEAGSRSMTGGAMGGEAGESGAKRRRQAGDGSIAPCSPENRTITVEGRGGGRGAFFSPRRVLSGQWQSPPAICPWKKYDETLRVVAEQRARTLLFRRARLRAQVQQLERFRATRPPDCRTWSSPEFLDKHRQSVFEITTEADTAFVDALHQSLREAEHEAREGAPKQNLTSRMVPPSPLGITTAPSLTGGGSNCSTIPEAESGSVKVEANAEPTADEGSGGKGLRPEGGRTLAAQKTALIESHVTTYDPERSDGTKGVGDAGGNDTGGDSGGGGVGVGRASSKPAAALSRLRRALSLGGMTRRCHGDSTSGAGNGKGGMAATSISKEGRPGADFVWAVKAAESDAAAARWRTFKTSTGRAEIARAVTRVKANIAKETAAAAAVGAAGEPRESKKMLGLGEARGEAAPTAFEASAGAAKTAGVSIGEDEESEATTGSARGPQAKEEFGGDGNAESLARRVKASTGAPTRTRVFERNKRALVERATQLFDLFDADGSGAIDREELSPLLRELGIWVSPDMEREVFPRLDLDCSGDVKREELATWLEHEGAGFRNTALSMLLRFGQSAQACGSSTRRLESQIRASMVARSRAAARAEAWAASGAAPTPAATVEIVERPSTTAFTTTALGTDDRLAARGDTAPSQKQEPIKQVNGNFGVVDAADAAGGAPAKLVVTGGRKRGQTLATRAATRKGRIEDQERGAERELLVRAAEDEAERRAKREWRTQAGAAELRREGDRMRGAGEALDLTLRAWDDLGRAGTATEGRSALRRKQAEEKLRHLFRLFDASCDGCIDAEELGRLLSRLSYPASEPEILGLLDKMDGDGSGDVDFSEFSAWWHEEGLRRSKRPGTLIQSAASALAATVAPKAAARRDAQRALISRARAKARSEVKGILRLEDYDGTRVEGVLPTSTPLPRLTEASPGERNVLSAEVIYGNTLNINSAKCGHGTGGGGLVVGSSRDRERLAAGRASKLARAEAEAYADVQATLRTTAGKRELARKTLALRYQWKEAIKAAERIAWYRHEKRQAAGGVSGSLDLNPEVDGEQPDQHQLHEQPPAFAEFVEVPFLRLLWGVHETATAVSPMRAAGGQSSPEGVEPSELKYLGASLRQALPGGGSASRVGGGEVNLLAPTVALGRTTCRATRFGGRIAGGDGGGGRNGGGGGDDDSRDCDRDLVEKAVGKGDGETLSLGGIFDNDSEDQVQNLKALARVGFGEFASSLIRQPVSDGAAVSTSIAGRTSTMAVNAIQSPAVAADVLSSSKQEKVRIKKDWTWLADVATITKMRKMLLMPGTFRRLAKEAMLAEGRAYERHELARSIALEDGEPWRLEEDASTKREGRSAGGAAPAEVDRLRATATGVAKLTRSLAQGEDLAAAECCLFLRTATGREELRATAAAVGEKRHEQLDLHATAAKEVDPGQSAIPGVRTVRRLASAVRNLARDELRHAFLLCEADGVSGEISRAEAAYVLAYAGISQKTSATAGRVRVPRHRKENLTEAEENRSHVRRKRGRRRKNQHRWQWPSWTRRRHTGRGWESRTGLLQPFLSIRKVDEGTGGRSSGERARKVGSSSSSSVGGTGGGARVCPTIEEGGCVGGSEVGGAAVPSRAGVTPRSVDSGNGKGQGGGEAREQTWKEQERQRGNSRCKEDVQVRQEDDRFGGGGRESDEINGDDDDDDYDDDHDERGSGSDDTSDGEFSVDMDMLDDVTSDEGFELGEMEILLAAAKTRQTLPGKALSLAHLLSRRTLPASLANTRDARMLLMSRARSAGRERTMHNFENLLTVDRDDGYATAAIPLKPQDGREGY